MGGQHERLSEFVSELSCTDGFLEGLNDNNKTVTFSNSIFFNDMIAVLTCYLWDARLCSSDFLLISSSSPTFPQDDIQIFINQQIKSQQQLEQPQKKPTSSNSMSFFRRPSRTASTWTRQSSSSSSWNSDCDQDKTQSPWREWLRRGKGAQYSK